MVGVRPGETNDWFGLAGPFVFMPFYVCSRFVHSQGEVAMSVHVKYVPYQVDPLELDLPGGQSFSFYHREAELALTKRGGWEMPPLPSGPGPEGDGETPQVTFPDDVQVFWNNEPIDLSQMESILEALLESALGTFEVNEMEPVRGAFIQIFRNGQSADGIRGKEIISDGESLLIIERPLGSQES